MRRFRVERVAQFRGSVVPDVAHHQRGDATTDDVDVLRADATSVPRLDVESAVRRSPSRGNFQNRREYPPRGAPVLARAQARVHGDVVRRAGG